MRVNETEGLMVAFVYSADVTCDAHDNAFRTIKLEVDGAKTYLYYSCTISVNYSRNCLCKRRIGHHTDLALTTL